MSDSHGGHRKVIVPECDILIHAGDITQFNDPFHYDDFFQWFSEQPAKHKLFIGGNHDDILDSQARSIFLNAFPDLIYLNESMVELMGLKIWGSAVQPHAFKRKMAFCRSRVEQMRSWDAMPAGMDIVVSHCPPQGILDQNVMGQQVGCEVLKDTLIKKTPLLNLFGHIHEAYGRTTELINERQCVFANCSVVNRSRTVVNKPWSFLLTDGQVHSK